MIQGILFDYGGTIDTNGLHWAVVLKNSYEKLGIDVPADLFKKAYSFGERSLAIHPLVIPSHTFLDVLRLKIGQQFGFLEENGYLVNKEMIEKIATDCNSFAKNTVTNAIPIIEELAKRFPLVMVSNFYGNLNAVLEDFAIRHFFTDVIESAVAGVRKPDPAIYQLGVDRIGTDAANCLVVGDSFAKDIIPAKKIGCKAAWLNSKGWDEDLVSSEYKADIEINDLSKLVSALKTL